jgi:NAD(P)-dependent dehydrogenase (short-subunit alcohol dehydrogenase family)
MARKSTKSTKPTAATRQARTRRKPATTDGAAPLRGKVALVTGGNRGIGFAIAQALVEAGAFVVITGRDERTLQTAAARLPKARPVHCDVRDPHSVERLFRVIGQKFGSLDILVNNAGLAHPNREIAKLSLAEWQEVIETNLTGLFLVTRAALLLMPAGSTIVNNLSVAARTIFPGMAAYTASKHGALGFTQTLREELRPRQIRVIALMPGATDTAIWDQIWPDAPRHKMITPKTVAKALLAAILLPANATLSELVITPTGGAL